MVRIQVLSVALVVAMTVTADASDAGGSAAIAATLRGSDRSAGAADRDQYRHPVETLAFFGFKPTMTVLDVGPGAGYYTELLAPVLAKDGLYLATNREQPSTAAAPSVHHWSPYEGVRFDDLLRAAPELYGKVQVIRVDYEAPKLNLDGKVDMVLLMREVHMMKNWGTLDTWLRETIEPLSLRAPWLAEPRAERSPSSSSCGPRASAEPCRLFRRGSVSAPRSRPGSPELSRRVQAPREAGHQTARPRMATSGARSARPRCSAAPCSSPGRAVLREHRGEDCRVVASPGPTSSTVIVGLKSRKMRASRRGGGTGRDLRRRQSGPIRAGWLRSRRSRRRHWDVRLT